MVPKVYAAGLMTVPSVLRAVKPCGSSMRWRRPAAARSFSISAQAASPVKPGDPVPSVILYEDSPDNQVKLTDLYKGKVGILFGVPGAFTPGCSKTHLPGFVSDYEKLKAAGADVISCVSVNDPFVMHEWGEMQGAIGKIHMLADPNAELAKALGITLEGVPFLGPVRMKRFSAVFKDGDVKFMNVEPDGTGLTCSLHSVILDQLKSL